MYTYRAMVLIPHPNINKEAVILDSHEDTYLLFNLSPTAKQRQALSPTVNSSQLLKTFFPSDSKGQQIMHGHYSAI